MSMVKNWLRAICGIPRYWKRSHDPHYVRLAMKREVLPRFMPGHHDFPFGRVEYADAASFEAQYHAIFVAREYALTTNVAAPVIIDCGGNIGLSTLWFKREYPQAQITVFEPGPELFAILERNIDRFSLENVSAVNAAVWDRETTLGLSNDRADGGFVHDNKDKGRTIRAVRLADRIDTPVDLLKMDIEGAEFAVMQDLMESGKLAQVRAIAGELHAGPEDAGKVGDLLSSLDQCGFKLTFSYARTAPGLFNNHTTTPFPSLKDGQYIALFYAWKPRS